MFSFLYTLYSSCYFFLNFTNVQAGLFCYSIFPFLLFFVSSTIFCKSFFFFFVFLYFCTNSQWLAFVDHLLREFVSDLCLKKLQSINIFFHSTILNNILNKKLLHHILYLFPHLLLCCLHLLLIAMLICCEPKINMTFILNCLIFLILFKFMLKKIMLMMLQMLNLLMTQMLKLLMLLLFRFCNSITQ